MRLTSTVAQKAEAQRLVDAFRSRASGGRWAFVDRFTTADELAARVHMPEIIHQGRTMWCGYASLIYSVAKRDPVAYVKFVIGLFEEGVGTLYDITIEASGSSRNSQVPDRYKDTANLAPRMPGADYIALVAIRNHFKMTIAGIAENIPILNLIRQIGGSVASEICNAMRALGCTNVYDQTQILGPRELGFLNAAGGHYDQGHTVLMPIDSSLLHRDEANRGHSNHWVALASSVTYSPDGKNVQFKVFSWGEIHEVDETLHVVQIRFFGYVVGW